MFCCTQTTKRSHFTLDLVHSTLHRRLDANRVGRRTASDGRFFDSRWEKPTSTNPHSRLKVTVTVAWLRSDVLLSEQQKCDHRMQVRNFFPFAFHTLFNFDKRFINYQRLFGRIIINFGRCYSLKCRILLLFSNNFSRCLLFSFCNLQML